MKNDVFVLQIVTNGPDGYPKDEIADIGICGVDLEKMEIESVYSASIEYPDEKWDDAKREYFKNGGLTFDDIKDGSSLNDVCKDIKRILNGGSVASFDIRNVFYRYMVNEPWDLTKEVSVMPSICSRLPASIGCGKPFEENVKIRLAYSKIFSEDVMNVGSGKRALDHALMSSAIMVELRKRERY